MPSKQTLKSKGNVLIVGFGDQDISHFQEKLKEYGYTPNQDPSVCNYVYRGPRWIDDDLYEEVLILGFNDAVAGPIENFQYDLTKVCFEGHDFCIRI